MGHNSPHSTAWTVTHPLSVCVRVMLSQHARDKVLLSGLLCGLGRKSPESAQTLKGPQSLWPENDSKVTLADQPPNDLKLTQQPSFSSHLESL